MSNQSSTDQQVWFITGASRGFGLEMTRQLLQKGHRAAATSRNLQGLSEAVATDSTEFLPLEMDLTSETSVGTAIQATLARFGRIDVVVNNAGYGQFGSLEEVSAKEAEQNFGVNVFGMLNVIRQVMPQLRKQRSGHVINISSVGGVSGAFPGWGVYCATKFAVEGLTEALFVEVAPFGIKATVVEPGYFRTDFLAGVSLQLPDRKIDDYALVRETESAHRDEINGSQPGDPVRGARAIIELAARLHPPLHLLLGADAYTLTEQKLASRREEMEQWKTLTHSTAFTGAASA